MTAASDSPGSTGSTAPSAPVVTSGRSTPDEGPRLPSGPPEVPVALVVAARKGDPAAFARMVEHWNPHLRPFVHHILAGEGSTDRALSAAYVRAYRALPRYRGERRPGLWLHRIAYLAATDELRRVRRDPARRRALADAGRSEDDHDTDPAPLAGPTDHATDHAIDLRIDAPAGDAADLTPGTAIVEPDADDSGIERLFFEPAPDHDAGPEAGSTTAPSSTETARPGTTDGADADPEVDAEPAADDDADSDHSLGNASLTAWAEEHRGTDVEAAIFEARNLMAMPDHAFPAGWRRLAPDQRALAVMVDLEQYHLDDAAGALDAETSVAAGRLNATRRLLARNRTSVLGVASVDEHENDTMVEAARATLAEIPIPAADPEFWSMLGRRLLAERESPAAPSIDPMARLAKAHPAEPGFKPRKHLRPLPGDPGYDPVHGLAEQADWVKPPRSRRRIVLLAIAAVVVVGLVGLAIRIGTSDRIPDGSETAADLAPDIAAAMAAGPYRHVEGTVVEQDAGGQETERPFSLSLAANGSWVVADASTIDQTTYDAASGLVRHVEVVGTGDALEVTTTDAAGLAAGAPDPSPEAPAPLSDLQVVPSIFRHADTARAPRSTFEGRDVWTLEQDLDTGDLGEAEQWRVRIDTETHLPVEIVRTREDRIVRHVQIDDWSVVTEVPPDTFLQPVPEASTPTSTDHGFITTELAAVPLLGRGEAVTPGWLPDGFELSVVAVRPDPLPGASSTADGRNPPDVGVLSLGFQRGAERITVTTRVTGIDRNAWISPFDLTLLEPTTRTIGDGRFNGTRVEVGTDVHGRAHLWGASDDSLLTIAGDLTADDAFRVAASLR